MLYRFLFFVCLFTPLVLSQDFLPGSYWCANPVTPDPESYNQQEFSYNPVYIGFSSAIRERMMPYCVKELKKQGVSKEIHTEGKKPVAVYYYNSDGLLTKYESKPYFNEILLEYDLNNQIKFLTEKGDGSSTKLDFIRDSMNRISSAETVQTFLHIFTIHPVNLNQS